MTSPLLIKLLVFDDKLAGAVSNLKDGFKCYCGEEVALPELDHGKKGEVFTPAWTGVPAATWQLSANNPKHTEASKVVRAIRQGTFDGPYDGILIDDNWGGSTEDSHGGHMLILPALLERRSLVASSCCFAIFSQELKSHNRAISIQEHWGHLAPLSEDRLQTILKSEHFSLSNWLKRLARSKAGLTSIHTPPAGGAHKPGRHQIVPVSIRGLGEIYIDGQRLYRGRRPTAVLGFLIVVAENREKFTKRADLIKVITKWKTAVGVETLSQAARPLAPLVLPHLDDVADFSQALDEFRKIVEQNLAEPAASKFADARRDAPKSLPGQLAEFIKVRYE